MLLLMQRKLALSNQAFMLSRHRKATLRKSKYCQTVGFTIAELLHKVKSQAWSMWPRCLDELLTKPIKSRSILPGEQICTELSLLKTKLWEKKKSSKSLRVEATGISVKSMKVISGICWFWWVRCATLRCCLFKVSKLTPEMYPWSKSITLKAYRTQLHQSWSITHHSATANRGKSAGLWL